MKLHHPSGIAVLALVAVISVAGTWFVQARGNPNPGIEWVLIQSVPKTAGGSGISITIQGYNFAATNDVETRGQVLVGGLTAVDGVAVNDPNSPGAQRFAGMKPQIIKFELPAGSPCATGAACPINVKNKNGRSNTVSFKL